MVDDKNQGEGDKTADKNYREAATSFAREHDTLKQGREAEREVEMYRDEFDSAERAGRAHSAGDLRSNLSKGFKK